MSNRQRSFIIPVVDYSPHSPYNIRTLLSDLEQVVGEVICIFNDPEPYEQLHDHPRIDKFCFNKQNVGVSRSWNMGLQMVEGVATFILNADLHVLPSAIDGIEEALFSLDRAVIAGPHGSYVDYRRQRARRFFFKGSFQAPIQTDDVSGFFFAIHMERFLKHGLLFDVRFSPCLGEEWDMGLQVRRAGLCCYAVPVTEFEHRRGISRIHQTEPIHYFGRKVLARDVQRANREKLIEKWRPIFPELWSEVPAQNNLSCAAPLCKDSESSSTD